VRDVAEDFEAKAGQAILKFDADSKNQHGCKMPSYLGISVSDSVSHLKSRLSAG
jgi:hypothetical protein